MPWTARTASNIPDFGRCVSYPKECRIRRKPMPVQEAIRVRLPNRPDELAKTSKWLAQAGVNIEAIAGVTRGEDGYLELLVNYPAVAVQTLKSAGIEFEEVQVALAWLPDRPGSLARAT